MNTIQEVFQFLIGVMSNLVYLLIGLALLGFLVGVLKYFRSASSPEGREKSVKYMTYGLISLVVITGLWGFVFLLGNTFGINISQDSADTFRNLEQQNTDSEGNADMSLGPDLRVGSDSFFGDPDQSGFSDPETGSTSEPGSDRSYFESVGDTVRDAFNAIFNRKDNEN
jgi:hypothetical protein